MVTQNVYLSRRASLGSLLVAPAKTYEELSRLLVPECNSKMDLNQVHLCAIVTYLAVDPREQAPKRKFTELSMKMDQEAEVPDQTEQEARSTPVALRHKRMARTGLRSWFLIVLLD